MSKSLDGCYVATLDGSRHFIPAGTDPEIIRQAIDPYDGIEPDLYGLPRCNIRIIRYHTIFNLVVFVFLIMTPILLAMRQMNRADFDEYGPKDEDAELIEIVAEDNSSPNTQ